MTQQLPRLVARVFHLCHKRSECAADYSHVARLSHRTCDRRRGYPRGVRIEDLGCELDGRPALTAVSLEAVAGRPLALLGPSGAGKSLALRCALGLAPAGARVRGRMKVGEHEVDLSDRVALARLRGRGVTLVSQAAAASLDPLRRIAAQLEEVNALHGDAAGPGPREQLAEVGLPPGFMRRFPHELSGGQAQRVALALALACRPAALLADEPTASLDTVAQAELLELLVARCAARGIALVLVCHDLAVAARWCGQAAVLSQGRVVARGPLADLIVAPPEPTTAAMVAAARRSG